MWIVSFLSILLWTQDSIEEVNIRVPLFQIDSVQITHSSTQEEFPVSSSEIRSLFKVWSASGPTYNNGKYIFTVSGGNNGKGIVFIDKDNYTEANFLSCSYEFSVADVRSQYPTQELVELYITLSDDDEPVPYGL